jgi:hypothetical protein
MEQYELREVMSGTEESYRWVTLGFSSELEEYDVLHVVCATSVDDEDRLKGMVDLYLERFDQAYSCCGGADEILVGLTSIRVRLNEKGRETLAFDGGVAFQANRNRQLTPWRFSAGCRLWNAASGVALHHPSVPGEYFVSNQENAVSALGTSHGRRRVVDQHFRHFDPSFAGILTHLNTALKARSAKENAALVSA